MKIQIHEVLITKLKNKWGWLLSGVLILLIIISESKSSAGDFIIFLEASKDIFSDIDVYSKRYIDGYHYYYDVWFALLIRPFVNQPLFVAKFFWLSINVIFIFRIFKIVFNWLDFSFLSNKQIKLFKLFSILFVFSFIRDNIHLAQMTIFTLFISLETIQQVNKKRFLFAAFLLALGIVIKIMPIVLIPYFIYRKEFKVVAWTFFMILCLLISPAFIIGWNHNFFLLKQRWNLINPSHARHLLDTEERSFHSLTTLLATLLVKENIDYHVMNIKRNIADISIESLNLIINIVRLLFVSLTIFALRTLPFKRSKNKLQTLFELSYILIITPLIFPHQQVYAFLYILPASTYLIYVYFQIVNGNYMVSKFKQRILLTNLILVFLLTSSHFFLGAFINYYDHFKTLTYGVIILSVTLLFFYPKLIDKQ